MKIVARSLLAAAALLAPVSMASAATVFYTQSFGPSSTDYTAPGAGNFSLAGFNSGLGTLTGVTITYGYTATMGGSVTNNAPSAQSFRVTEDSSIDFNFSGSYSNTSSLDVAYTQYYNGSASTPNSGPVASGQSKNFGGVNPGDTYTGSDSGSITPVSLASFVNNPLLFNVQTNTGVTIIGGGGNITTAITTTGSGFATVTYDYVASAAVPEPASWAMMVGGFGVIGGALRRRKVTGVTFA